MSKRTSLTPAAIDALSLGHLLDPKTPGLLIEACARGGRIWRYRRKVLGTGRIHKRTLGRFPKFSIADARTWAGEINAQIEAGVDPEILEREAFSRATFTVAHCHGLYMDAVRLNQHRTRRTKTAKPLKPGTIAGKLELYTRDVHAAIGHLHIESVTEKEIDAVIHALNARGAETQANNVGAELRVFFGWACSRRGEAAGIHMKSDPTARLRELWNPKAAKTRWLDHEELPLLLRAIAQEPQRLHRRCLLLLLLTGVRKSELIEAPSSEVRDGRWIIPGERTKNGLEHPIALAPWTAKLIQTNDAWILASPKIPSQPMRSGWPKVIERVRARMAKIGKRDVAHFTPHDLRRTMRSHIEDHGIDEALAERMINHKLTGLVEVYNRNKRAAAIAAGFLAWDRALATMAIAAGVAEELEVILGDDRDVEPEPASVAP
jgi:integrase